MKAPLHENEKRRLDVLWHYEVLDTSDEQSFDDLAELAAEICGAPIATVTLVDEKRQWFKSKIGITAAETSRDISFCAHAILKSELMIIPDALKDSRFVDNPLVTGEPHIRFYAGAPLINPEGYPLGTLCVIDTVPRDLTASQRNALEVLARHVVTLLELRRLSAQAIRLEQERRHFQENSLRTLQSLADHRGGALEQVSTEKKLGEERNLLRTLLDHLPDYVFVKDLQSRHLLVNKSHARFRGLTDSQDAIGRTLFESLPKEMAERYRANDLQVFKSGEALVNREERVVDSAGNVHWLLTTKVPLRDKANKVIGLVGISRDITERKRIETALRETEEIFRLISENVSDLIAVLDAKGRRIYNSPSYEKIFNDAKLLKGTDSFARIHPEDQQHVREVFEETLRTGVGQRIEYRFLLQDNSVRYIESQGNYVRGDTPESSKVVVVSREITERKRVERRDAALSRLGRDLSAAISPKAAALVISDATLALFGWDVFNINLCSIDDKIIRPVLGFDTLDGKRVQISNDRAGGPPSPLSLRVIQNGAQLILKEPPFAMLKDAFPVGDVSRPSASLMFVPIRNGIKVMGVLSIQSYSAKAYTAQDLDALQTIADHCGGAFERIRAEEALRASELRFHSVWENSVDGMRLTDENGTIIAVNKAFCKLVDLKFEELEGKPFTVTYSTTANHADLLKRYQERFRNRTIAKFMERKLVFHSGKTAELEGSNSFIDLSGERPLLLGLFRDITEQKRLESQLRHSQKMESIGQLAGGIAHDFNNLLTVIQGHTSLLVGEGHTPEISGSLQEISLAAERSANLTRQLLTFSRRQVMQRKSLDLKDVVDEMIRMLRRILGEDVLLTVENTANLPRIKADRGMMEQILLNLAVNSRDAMPRGGKLAISTRIVRIDETYTRQNTEAYLGEFVCLTVSDTGLGIEPENLVHIFEPFFTTKEVGKGTGLGLATVYGIVKQHDGWIEVASEVDKGTVFKIFFPRNIEAVEPCAPVTPKTLSRGTETILVVEDEPSLRQLVRFILQRQGYRVLEANSGAAALNVWKENKQLIDMLLTDMIMPEGMNGTELSDLLKAENPKLKVIFTSGYSADMVGKNFAMREGLNFLQKPYHPEKLMQAVRDCLDREPDAPTS